MQPNVSNNAGIHCKVSCHDEFRRFLFIGTEFSSLYSQVQQMLSLNKEFVLKYKDNEGDLITISSTEELNCALGYSEGNILRFTAVPIVPTDLQQQLTAFPTAIEFPSHNFGRRGGRGGRFTLDGPEAFKSKLIFKRDKFQSILAELAQAGQLTPDQQNRQSILQVKLKKIEGRLAKFEEGAELWEKRARKWEEKAEKYKNKHKDHDEKHEKDKKDKKGKQFSEETKAQIETLQTQIDTLKPGFKEVKYQMKAKKVAMKEAKAVGGITEQLSNEMAQLKEVWKAQKKQMRPLQEQLYALKHAY